MPLIMAVCLNKIINALKLSHFEPIKAGKSQIIKELDSKAQAPSGCSSSSPLQAHQAQTGSSIKVSGTQLLVLALRLQSQVCCPPGYPCWATAAADPQCATGEAAGGGALHRRRWRCSFFVAYQKLSLKKEFLLLVSQIPACII